MCKREHRMDVGIYHGVQFGGQLGRGDAAGGRAFGVNRHTFLEGDNAILVCTEGHFLIMFVSTGPAVEMAQQTPYLEDVAPIFNWRRIVVLFHIFKLSDIQI